MFPISIYTFIKRFIWTQKYEYIAQSQMQKIGCKYTLVWLIYSRVIICWRETERAAAMLYFFPIFHPEKHLPRFASMDKFEFWRKNVTKLF